MIDLLSHDLYDNVKHLFEQIKEDDEFEFMFFNYRKSNPMSLENYNKLLSYIQSMDDVQHVIALDINFDDLRVTINGQHEINAFMSACQQKNKSSIIVHLYNLFKEQNNGDEHDKKHGGKKRKTKSGGDGTKHIQIMKKIKSKKNVVDIDDFDIRCRLSQEQPVSENELKKLVENGLEFGLRFRYKQRLSAVVYDDKNAIIRFDLTKVQSFDAIKNYSKSVVSHEFEIELQPIVGSNGKIALSNKHLDQIFVESSKIIKMFQQSNFIISNTTKKMVLDKYAQIFDVDFRSNTLYGRQPVSLELRHLTNNLPNKYSVTDKADGDRHMLIIVNNRVYLITTNLFVRYTGFELTTKNKEYENTILDGEYIFILSENKYVFMIFDCLFHKQNDVRNLTLFKRLEHAYDVVNNCFVESMDDMQLYKMYNADKFEMAKICAFHIEELKNSINQLNKMLKRKTKTPIIRVKYFVPVYGISENEIYFYSAALWNLYMYDTSIKCPYVLDGLIYQPLQDKYIVEKTKISNFDYKWKPPEKNTIDFYIEFKRDENGNVVYAYDNTLDDVTENKLYKICYLNVGLKNRSGEVPTYFRNVQNEHFTHLFVDDNKEVVDVEGDIIVDKTVVEFYYNNDPSIDKHFRWVPLRIRYDKTESVMRHQQKYGNNVNIADRIWNSIQKPVLMIDFEMLANSNTFASYSKSLLVKQAEASKVESATSKQIYYQLDTNLAKPMRAFHNWIKNDLISKFAKHKNILDYACGRGGDIQKYYFSRVKFYVGIDVDYNGLFSNGNGAMGRYHALQQKYRDFPKMVFINVDGGTLFNYSAQSSVIKSMSDENKQMLEQYLTGKMLFDVISCQFAIHYFLENELKFNNFCQNIASLININGYFVATAFDEQEVLTLLNNKQSYTLHYTTPDGNKITLFEIVSKFNQDSFKSGLGNAIDVHNAWISEPGVYQQEFLVNKDFLIKMMKQKCRLDLVETKLFSEVFVDKQHEIETMNSKDTFGKNILEYYDKTNELNKLCYNVTNLNRYYVFKRA